MAKKMNSISDITKTVAVGMIVGGAVSATAAVLKKPKKMNLKKTAKRTISTVTSAIENIADYIK